MTLRLATAIALLSGLAWAGTARAEEAGASIRVTGAWARPTLGASMTVAAYLTVLNDGTSGDRVIALDTDIAKAAEMHTTVLEGDIVQMRRLEAVEVAPGRRTSFAPGGMHIMLIGVVRPLKQGERFRLTLRFERHTPVEADVLVSLQAPAGPRGSIGAGGS